ncbi:iron-containing alcohol dehydrogenase [Amycolatopsis thermophila]|uniref:Alcohol dehydrogenase class IV n=1 Tax=Amycolatopsis thermophila TaxID=206084 RepID=A0ABU0F197_9PSEU|nr:iron-containing alcohol dehydrogenase [Amycolatopsis thermophila]MDQ0381158.1 alcohol dehydrogenase class IV [Amycolatopsis thermophila]
MTTQTPLAGRFDVLPLESVLFGPGVSGSLAVECAKRSVRRLFVVASPSLARQIDVRERFAAATGGRVAAVFTGGRPHVPHDVVLAATRAAREAGADGVLSVGGGSAIDLAKAVVLCLAEGIDSAAALLRWKVVVSPSGTKQSPVTTAPKVPHFTVSTTLSAGEFTHIIGITDTTRGAKDLYLSPDFVPRVVALDPGLAAHTPRSLWASTGIKAVDHAVETLCSPRAQPVTDALAADALRRLTRHLPASVRDAGDLHAAGQCQLGAWQSIFGVTNVSLGLSHGIAHQLGGRLGVAHGVASCVLLPTVLEHHAEHTRGPQRLIADILAETTGHPAGLGAPELLRRFIAGLRLPTGLREAGVGREEFPAIARHTVGDLMAAAAPGPALGTDDVEKILGRAW